MKNTISFIKDGGWVVTVAVVVGVLAVFASVNAATVINTSINTAGAIAASTTLEVLGLSTQSGGVLVNNATSTITNVVMVTSTTTNATSTTLYVSGLARFPGAIWVNAASSTINNLNTVNASSTNLDVTNGTTTSATSTSLFATTLQATNATTSTSLGTARLIVTATSSLATTTMPFLGVGTTTPLNAGNVATVGSNAIIDGTATTTLYISTSGGATTGTCIQMISAAHANIRLYFATGGQLISEVGTCK